MSVMKNPYDPNSPEWQLWENWNHTKSLISTYQQDIERFQRKIIEQRDKLAAYEAALEKLDPKFGK